MIKVFLYVLIAGLDQHDFHVLWEILGQSIGIAERWEVLLQHATGLFYGGLFLLSGHSSLHLVEVRTCMPTFDGLKSSIGRKMAAVHFTRISCKPIKYKESHIFATFFPLLTSCLWCSGCIPFVRISRLGWPLNEGKGIHKSANEPNEMALPFTIRFPVIFLGWQVTENWKVYQTVRKFPLFRSERKKKVTSGGSL